jgi:hypothetical protein
MDSSALHGPVQRADATTNDQGEATLKASLDIDALIIAASRYEISPLRLVATAPGKGLATIPLGLDKTQATLDLPPETPIEGTLKAPDGSPARDVRVHMQSVRCGSDWLKPAWGDYTKLHTPDYMPQDATTDADGHFTMHGMPAGGEALLEPFSDHFARLHFYVSSGPKQTERGRGSGMEIVPPRFTLTLQAARIFEGNVIDVETGKPLAGAIVDVGSSIENGSFLGTFGRTDADGSYRIGAYQAKKNDFNTAYTVSIYPVASSGYLGIYWQLPRWPDPSKTLFKKDFALSKGRLIQGRITEGGRPVAGASVTYQPKPGNKFDKYTKDLQYDLRNSTLTDADGKFVVTALPGSGFIIAQGPGLFARVKLPVEETDGNSDLFPNGYVQIDVPETGSVPSVEIKFKRGLSLEARVLQPDGKPVPYVMALCREQTTGYMLGRHDRGQRFEAGLFQLANCEPGKSYRVLFMEPDLKLGAVADLVADPKRQEPIEVKLQPTASVSGRAVNEDGSPALEAHPHVDVSLMAGPTTIPPWDQIRGGDQWAIYANLFGQQQFSMVHSEMHTDAKGDFHLTRLVPGAPMWFFCGYTKKRDTFWARQLLEPLKPGESRDLGTLVLKKHKLGE